MILPFSIQLNGKPTYFVEKILKSFNDRQMTEADEDMVKNLVNHNAIDLNHYELVQPKIHSIRDDVHKRWRKDVMIDFFINTRKPNMMRFAKPLLYAVLF